MLSLLAEALAGSPGARLLDVGGGTGNYAVALAGLGFEPLVLDRSPAMLERAAAKGLETIEGDARELPFRERSFDAVTMLSMLHHVDEPAAAIAEAKRVLAEGGRLALKGYYREDIADLWLLDYFPSSRPWMEETHPPVAELERWLPGAERRQIVFTEVEDGSLAALAAWPELILDPRRRRQTSYFERLERDDPEGHAAGLERLRRDLAAGDAPRTPGRASVLTWTKP